MGWAGVDSSGRKEVNSGKPRPEESEIQLVWTDRDCSSVSSQSWWVRCVGFWLGESKCIVTDDPLSTHGSSSPSPPNSKRLDKEAHLPKWWYKIEVLSQADLRPHSEMTTVSTGQESLSAKPLITGVFLKKLSIMIKRSWWGFFPLLVQVTCLIG